MAEPCCIFADVLAGSFKTLRAPPKPVANGVFGAEVSVCRCKRIILWLAEEDFEIDLYPTEAALSLFRELPLNGKQVMLDVCFAQKN